MIAIFAEHFSINFVVIEERPILLNYRARSIPQSGKVGSDMGTQPYTQAGLRGDKQVIGVADTGVDSFNCYFYDPKGRVRPSDLSSPYVDKSFRKIVQYNYNGCGDQSDAEGGHGTHVAGTAVGSIAAKDIATGQFTLTVSSHINPPYCPMP